MSRKRRHATGRPPVRNADRGSERRRRDAQRTADSSASAKPDEAFDRPAKILYWAAAIGALLLLAFLAFFPIQSDDIFMYLAIGRRIVRERALPTTDPFLFSIPNYHWHVLHEWASHLIAYGLYCLGGWNALIVAKTLALLAAAGTALATAWRLGVRSAVVPLLLLLAAAAGCPRFIERSSLVSDFFTAAVLAIVALERASPGRLRYLLPFIFLAWVNLHPGFYVGLAVCGLAVLSDIRRIRQRRAQTFAACVLASALLCLANPDGLAGVLYPLRPVFDPTWDAYRMHNFEWMSTLSGAYVDSVHVLAFVAVIGLCVLLALAALPCRPWFEITILALLTWLGLSAIRFVITASFSLAVLGAVFASKSWFRESGVAAKLRRKLGMTANAGAALVAVAVAFKVAFWGYDTPWGSRHLGGGIDGARHPVQAAEFIEQIGLEANLYNEHSFGSYLAWRWDGRRKLFYHGFVDDLVFYKREFLGVDESPEQFNRIVNEYNLGAFLLRRIPLSPTEGPLIYIILLTSPDWRLVYQDQRAMLFLRNIPENQEAQARCVPPP